MSPALGGKGSTTLGKAVFFSISKKKLKLRLPFATLSKTRKKTPEFLRGHLGGASQLHKDCGGKGRIPGKSEVVL